MFQILLDVRYGDLYFEAQQKEKAITDNLNDVVLYDLHRNVQNKEATTPQPVSSSVKDRE